MAVGGGVEDEVVGTVAAGFGAGVQRVPRDDDGGEVAAAAALRGDAAGVGAGKAKEVCETGGSGLFDDG